jgi:recombination protein RecA
VFGNPETTTGGRALKFYSSVRVEVRRISSLKDGDQVIGNRTRVKVVKNKVAAPFREAEIDILYGQGISREGDLLDMGAEQGIVEKSGAWFSFDGERLGQGRENSRTFLKEHPELRERIDAGIRLKIGLPKQGSVPAPDTAVAPEPVPHKSPAPAASRAAAQTA